MSAPLSCCLDVILHNVLYLPFIVFPLSFISVFLPLFPNAWLTVAHHVEIVPIWELITSFFFFFCPLCDSTYLIWSRVPPEEAALSSPHWQTLQGLFFLLFLPTRGALNVTIYSSRVHEEVWLLLLLCLKPLSFASLEWSIWNECIRERECWSCFRITVKKRRFISFQS